MHQFAMQHILLHGTMTYEVYEVRSDITGFDAPPHFTLMGKCVVQCQLNRFYFEANLSRGFWEQTIAF